jgi:hypothetical protein
MAELIQGTNPKGVFTEKSINIGHHCHQSYFDIFTFVSLILLLGL